MLALLLHGSSSVAAPQGKLLRPQTLATVHSSIRGFGQDGARIAWLTGTDGRRCTRTLHVRTLSTRVARTSLESACTRNPSYRSRVALAGRAAAWDSFLARDKSGFWAAMVTAEVPQQRARRIAAIQGIRVDGYPDSYPTPAGAGNVLAYSTPEGVRRIVAGKARRLFAFSRPLGLAVSHGVVAVVGQRFRPGDGCGCISSPDWRADGTIGFLSELAPPPQGKKEVMLIDPSGSGRTVLIDDDRWRFGLDWSQDGTKLAYSYTIGNGITVAVANADGSQPHDVGPGDDPSLSPDGSKVAFDRYNGTFFVYVANADGSGERLVDVGYDPAWSPDGTRLAFSTGGQLALTNPDGSGLQKLGLQGSRPQWSPDGTRLAYENHGIWVANADGSDAHRLSEKANGHSPHWSRDGGALVFVSGADSELYVVNADGTGLKPLTSTVPASWATVGEVRRASGRRVAPFEARGASAGVALAGAKVAVGTRDPSGRGLLTLFAASTGKELARFSLPGTAPVVVGANARWVVFRTGKRAIRAFDLRTSTTRTLAIPAVAPVGVSVSGRRVAWAENLGELARIRALSLPR